MPCFSLDPAIGPTFDYSGLVQVNESLANRVPLAIEMCDQPLFDQIFSHGEITKDSVSPSVAMILDSAFDNPTLSYDNESRFPSVHL